VTRVSIVLRQDRPRAKPPVLITADSSGRDLLPFFYPASPESPGTGQNRTETELRSERINLFSLRAFRSQNITSVSGLICGHFRLNALGNRCSIQLSYGANFRTVNDFGHSTAADSSRSSTPSSTPRLRNLSASASVPCGCGAGSSSVATMRYLPLGNGATTTKPTGDKQTVRLRHGRDPRPSPFRRESQASFTSRTCVS